MLHSQDTQQPGGKNGTSTSSLNESWEQLINNTQNLPFLNPDNSYTQKNTMDQQRCLIVTENNWNQVSLR